MGLLQAVRIVRMPDDPRLGEFRESSVAARTDRERPEEADSGQRVSFDREDIDGSEKLFEELEGASTSAQRANTSRRA